MRLLDKLRWIRRARKRHPPDVAEQAGETGEIQASRIIENLRLALPVRCFRALRVPKTSEKGKHEIDFLVASPFALVALEVKHWGGDVEMVGTSKWRQVSSSGEIRIHEDPLARNRTKLCDLLAYLQKNGAPLRTGLAHSLLVLTNDRVDLGTMVANEEGVVRTRDLESALRGLLAPCRLSGFRLLLVRLGLCRLEAPIRDLEGMVRVIERLPTWDRVELFGDALLRGDVQNRGLVLHDGSTITRRETVEIRIEIPRSLWTLLRRPSAHWKDSDGRRRRAALRLPQQIELKLGGRNEVRSIPIEHVQRVTFGWRDESYYDLERPALRSYRPGMRFAGTIAGITEFGVFVNLDGHRDGLVHVSTLRRRRMSPTDYAVGEPLTVRVQATAIRKGKETIDLELSE